MKDVGPLHSELMAMFEHLTPRQQVGARYILDHSQDVALVSMRELSKRAGVPPATMTRLAQRMGFDGFDDLRSLYADSMRRRSDGFADRATELVDRWKAKGESAIGADLCDAVARQIDGLRTAGNLDAIAAAAQRVAASRRIFTLGQRSSYPVAHHLAYLLGLIGCDARLVDAPGGSGADHLQTAGADDLLIVVTIRPYARASLILTELAAARGVPVVAITDSVLSPIAPHATATLVVGVETPSFFHSMVPAFTTIEVLAALVAAALGTRALDALKERERLFDTLDVMVDRGSRATPVTRTQGRKR